MSVEQSHQSASAEILEIGTSRTREEYVIELAGELDLSGVARVGEVFAAALDTDAREIVLDLRDLQFLDSTGVYAILKAERLASARDRSFVIVRGPRQVQRIFEISGIVDLLSFSDG